MAKPKPLPDVLYKYYKPDRIDVFDTLAVRFSQLAALNDPFEFLINVAPGEIHRAAERAGTRLTSFLNIVSIGASGALKAVKTNEMLQKAPWLIRVFCAIIFVPLAVGLMVLLQPFLGKQIKRLMRAAATEFENIILNDARRGLVLVFSCTERWDSVPMWAHYAANHEGFALGIDPATAFPDTNPEASRTHLRPRPVRYQDQVPRFSAGKMGLHDFVCVKMNDWAYEKEWRYIQFPDFALWRRQRPKEQEVLLFSLEAASIKEVLFGANCRRETAATIIGSLSSRGLSPKLWQVRRSPGYGFIRVPIVCANDLEPVSHAAGPIGSVADRPFAEFEGALDAFQRDALAHPLVSKLYRPDPKRAPNG